MLKLRTKYAPGSCIYNNEYHEIRWDFSGCNLKCQFCWSPASRPLETNDKSVEVSPSDLVSATKRNIQNSGTTFIRFTGGEPTLQWKSLKEALNLFQNDSASIKPPILIQTNGIEIGNGNISLSGLFTDPSQLYLVELSFKGTNSSEFELLTSKSGDLFRHQIAAYKILKTLTEGYHNVCVVAVLGVYHSAIKGSSKYAFVNPKTNELLFDEVEKWDPTFAYLWRSANLKWVEPLRMSPLGVWKNLYNRCGPSGSGILKYFPYGIRTNQHRMFQAKPKSIHYAKKIIDSRFW